MERQFGLGSTIVVNHMSGRMGGIPEKVFKIGGKNEKDTHESS